MNKLSYVVLTLAVIMAAPSLSWAGRPVATPELDPGSALTALALLGGAAAIVVERFRRRQK
jgi:hypothetical protein